MSLLARWRNRLPKRPAGKDRAEERPVQVIGLCRFSYPAAGGFQINHASPEDRARFLYDPARLEARLRSFEALTLPCLRAQSDPDFSFLVVIGNDLPGWSRARLEALLADLPQAVLQAHPPGGAHRQVMQAAINSLRLEPVRRCLQFRLDDDDAVNCRFVERLRAAALDARPLAAQHRLLAIDFNQGHIVRPGPEGLHSAPVKRAYWAPGLAVLAGPWVRLTVMNFNHARLWHHMPTLTLPEPDMFLRGISETSDSAFHRNTPLTLLDAAGEAHFRTAFGICAERVRQLYAPGG
ncbi:MAG: hypothetical protein JK586_09395 [Nocardiopsis sp. BM-2018]|nr:MAG: hypothetical protein JK586_09395 [Nocardiopsis sp. BM-2018]